MNLRRRVHRRSIAKSPLFEGLESRLLLSGGPYTFAPVLAFNNVTALQGTDPNALVADSHGNLFGTTAEGGVNGYGTIFEVVAGTTTVKTLANFSNSANGFNPAGPLVLDSHGNIFGVAVDGGANDGAPLYQGGGTIYELAAGASTVTVLASFSTATGFYPFGGLFMDSAGNLYGTTYNNNGNGANDGDVFKFNIATKTFTVLHAFSGGDGSNSSGPLVMDSQGNIFGTTYNGGANSDGEVFEIAAGTDAFYVVASFNSNTGSNPTGSLLLDSAGNLFGMTSTGGAHSDGTLFEIPAGTGSIYTIAAFDGDNGNRPTGSLIRDAQGDFFGVTANGGAHSDGTVYVMPAGTGTIVTLWSFTGGADGSYPSGGLVMAPSGSIYGSTFGGGTYKDGTLFELQTPSVTAADPLPNGVIDAAGPLVVRGWAIDQDTPATAVTVKLYVDGTLFDTTTANVTRPGLTALYGSANHGFSFDISSLTPGLHRIEVFALDTTSGTPAEIGAPRVVDTNAAPVGSLDRFDGTSLVGWAADANAGAAPIQIRYVIDNNAPVVATASVNRPGLTSYFGSADHGFDITLPQLTAGLHTVRVYAVDSTTQQLFLLGTRTAIVASPTGNPLPMGAVDSATMTRVAGWAGDRSTPGTAIQVRIDVDGVAGVPFTTTVVRRGASLLLGAAGAYGFDEELSLTAGEHRIDIYAIDAPSGTLTLLASRIVSSPPPAGLISPAGMLDTPTASQIKGWAWSAALAGASPTVRIDIDGQAQATVVTSISRPGVAAIYGAGNFGVSIATPDLLTGQHTVSLVLIDPLTLTPYLLAVRSFVVA